ncbi:hypothetical protein Taro_042092 [Colocasia esculenta]|uniref:Lipase-like C-terminal domain-containing protein n=1 Tax=Colocasia esculenta TaxID=4460 RepID=A0A843WNK4_COLES|nr:hypothetical protein [Colocasia esculenta]
MAGGVFSRLRAGDRRQPAGLRARGKRRDGRCLLRASSGRLQQPAALRLRGWAKRASGKQRPAGGGFFSGQTTGRQDLSWLGFDDRRADWGLTAADLSERGARELFYFLKGGQVDYGKEHSRSFGHLWFGRVYEQGTKPRASCLIRFLHFALLEALCPLCCQDVLQNQKFSILNKCVGEECEKH